MVNSVGICQIQNSLLKTLLNSSDQKFSVDKKFSLLSVMLSIKIAESIYEWQRLTFKILTLYLNSVLWSLDFHNAALP